MLILKNPLKTVFVSTDINPKNIQKAFLFIFAYLCLSGISVLGFAQFFPKLWFWYAWGLSASVASVYLWKWFLKNENKHFPDQWITLGKNTLGRFVCGFGIGLLTANKMYVSLWGSFLILSFKHFLKFTFSPIFNHQSSSSTTRLNGFIPFNKNTKYNDHKNEYYSLRN